MKASGIRVGMGLAIGGLLAMPFSLCRAWTVEIEVPNASFEQGTGVAADNDWYSLFFNPQGGRGYDEDNLLAGWTLCVSQYRFGGRLNPGDNYYTNTTDEVPHLPPNLQWPAEGTQCAFLHWGGGASTSDSWITSYTNVAEIAADTDYELRVAVGTPVIPALPQPVKVTRVAVRLLANGFIVASNDSAAGGTAVPDPGQWTNVVVTLSKETVASGGYAGQPLKIELYAKVNGVEKKQVNFDNVRLTATGREPPYGTVLIVR